MKYTPLLILGLILGLGLFHKVPGAVIGVDASGNSDYTTITDGLAYASSGDTVYVYNGIYTVALGEKFPISIPANISLVGQSYEHSIIDANGSDRVVLQVKGCPGVTIQELMIINGKKGIKVTNGSDSLVVNNCYLKGNTDQNIEIKDSNHPTINNCVVVESKHGIILKNVLDAHIIHNTIVGNDSTTHVHGIKCNASTARIAYNIIDNFGRGIEVDEIDSDLLDIAHNNVFRSALPYYDQDEKTTFSPPADSGNTAFDPLFVDPANGDYRVAQDSPVAGKGAYNGQPLPVVLSCFNAEIVSPGIRLQWQTESEKDNLGWHVFRADNPQGPFMKISQKIIAGAGHSSKPRHYSYLDSIVHRSAITLYYYLEQTDYTGQSTVSDTISIQVQKTGISWISRIPGGQTGNTQSGGVVPLPGDRNTQVIIHDMQGRKTGTINWDMGKRPPLRFLPAGTYILELTEVDQSRLKVVQIVK
jgi:parallel beta-helix repeat protein